MKLAKKTAALFFLVTFFSSNYSFAAPPSKPPVCFNQQMLPKPIPPMYHFYCNYPAGDENTMVVMWNHAVLIKGFTNFRGGLITSGSEINSHYFTAKPDPHHSPDDQGYLCSFPNVSCYPGTGAPGENRKEFPGEFGSDFPQ